MAARLNLIVNDVAATIAPDYTWPGGKGSFTVESSAWGGGNVKLQCKSPNGTWVDADASLGTLTANGVVNFELPRCELRAVRTTATGVYAYAVSI